MITVDTGPVVAEAERQFRAAERRGGVEVRELHQISEFRQVFALYDDIWHADPGKAPISTELMRAMSHSGNYVTGAFDGARLVGACVGFFADPVGTALHSHVTGALPGRGIGFALKLHQRAWALARGLSTVFWTYDPLVRRNAHFNIAKLGARPEEYLESFYGPMADAINAGDESDRLLVVWRLTEPRVVAACSGTGKPPLVPDEARVALAAKGDRPVKGTTDGRVSLVQIPRDVETLRRTDPTAARAWRHATRDVLGGLIGQGARVTGFTSDGHYILERQ